MLKIRLQRIGRKNDPSYRVVVVDSHTGPKSGKHIEILGSYNPRESKVVLEGERIKHWLSQGAQASGTVHNLLVNNGVLDGKKVNVLPKKSPIKKEEEAAPEAAAAPVEGAESAEEGSEAPAEAPAAEAAPEAPEEKPAEETPAEEEKKEA